MRTLDGFHYTHNVRPEWECHLVEPRTIEELEDGYEQRSLGVLRMAYWVCNPYQPLPKWGLAYEALVEALEAAGCLH